VNDLGDFQFEEQQIIFAAANSMIREARWQALSRDGEPITSRCCRWFTEYSNDDRALATMETSYRALVAKEAMFDLLSTEQDASALDVEWDALRRHVLSRLEDSQLDCRFSFEDAMMRTFVEHQSIVRSKLLQFAIRVKDFQGFISAKSGNEDIAHDCLMYMLWDLCQQAARENSFLNAPLSSREKPRR